MKKQNEVKNAPNYLSLNYAVHPITASGDKSNARFEQQTITSVVNETNEIWAEGHQHQNVPLFTLGINNKVGSEEKSEAPAY